jgi:hypothetical protein
VTAPTPLRVLVATGTPFRQSTSSVPAFAFGSRSLISIRPLALVVSDAASPDRRRSRLAYVCLWETGIAADVLVWARSEFESRLHLPASLPATVLREGRLLHAA